MEYCRQALLLPIFKGISPVTTYLQSVTYQGDDMITPELIRSEVKKDTKGKVRRSPVEVIIQNIPG